MELADTTTCNPACMNALHALTLSGDGLPDSMWILLSLDRCLTAPCWLMRL